jgi:hypothetical protein
LAADAGSDDCGQLFRLKPDSDSDRWRTAVPVDGFHGVMPPGLRQDLIAWWPFARALYPLERGRRAAATRQGTPAADTEFILRKNRDGGDRVGIELGSRLVGAAAAAGGAPNQVGAALATGTTTAMAATRR